MTVYTVGPETAVGVPVNAPVALAYESPDGSAGVMVYVRAPVPPTPVTGRNPSRKAVLKGTPTVLLTVGRSRVTTSPALTLKLKLLVDRANAVSDTVMV